MELKEKNNKRTLVSVIVTILFHGAVLLLLFAMGLKYPDPPPPEQGVVMDIGDLIGEGNALIGEKGGSDEQASIHETSSSEENYVAQNSEESTIVTKKSETPKKKQETTEETINPNALFRKGKVKSEDGGGVGQGQGSGIGQGKGTGGGGTGYDLSGSGTTFSLEGRGSKSLSIPSSKTDEVGVIIVKIWVNQEGDVTRAVAGEKGTTIGDRSLWIQCQNAARRSKFSENPNAPFEQIGTITYKYRR